MKASHHDISANIGDGVSIRLPRLRFEIERRQAERLRDVLNTVLPPAVGQHYLLHMWDHVDPEISGPYKDEQDRTESAQDFRRAHGCGNSVYRLTSSQVGLTIEAVPAADLAMAKPIARVPVHVGDRVLDPRDGQWREVMSIDPCGTVNMRDGGVMSVAECEAAEKRLPSEELPS